MKDPTTSDSRDSAEGGAQLAVSRRRALVGFGAGGLALLLAACTKAADNLANGAASSTTSKAPSSPSSSTAGSSRSSGSSGTAGASGSSCTITPELTEGPYYLDLDLVRSDIRDGRPGVPLELKIIAVDADGCTPLTNAAVDIWHCDAAGEYSGVDNTIGGGGGGPGGPGGPGGRGAPSGRSGGSQSTTGSSSGTFLRGTQVTDNQGVATFTTIYPGAYTGRAVHIHFKVHPDANREMTGQLFVPDDLSQKVYADGTYANSQRFMRNNADSIYQQSRGTTVLQPTSSGDGYTASITVGVAKGGNAGNSSGRRA